MPLKKFIITTRTGYGPNPSIVFPITSSTFPGAPYTATKLKLIDGYLETFNSFQFLTIGVTSGTSGDIRTTIGATTSLGFFMPNDGFENTHTFRVDQKKIYDIGFSSGAAINIDILDEFGVSVVSGLVEGYLVFELTCIK